MAADVCEIINVELSDKINTLITNKYPISLLHLTKGIDNDFADPIYLRFILLQQNIP